MGRLDALVRRVAAKQALLQGTAPSRLANLQHAHDLELTYTSNAIEGNTLSAAETTLVVEQGITIGGKPLRDHLEAIDHHAALGYVRVLARHSARPTEADLRTLHRLVMLRSAPEMAGRYAYQGRYVVTDTGRHAFPSPVDVPLQMAEFVRWLGDAPAGPHTAFAAHRRLVEIHPFNDGNGRAARLLMNLLLIQAGYPPVSVRPQDRAEYLNSLQTADDGFSVLLYTRLDETLDEYLEAARQASEQPGPIGPPPPR